MPDAFDALAHPVRRALVAELRGGAQRAGDLGQDLDISREAVGKHLRILTAAGVLAVDTRGRERWYSLAPGGLQPVDDWLQPYRAFWAQRLDALSTEVARGQRASRIARQPANAARPTEHTPEQPASTPPAADADGVHHGTAAPSATTPPTPTHQPMHDPTAKGA